MLFKNFLWVIPLALAVAAAGSPSGDEILTRFKQLADDYKTLTNMTAQLATGDTTIGEIIAKYNQTFSDEARDENSSQPTGPYATDIQDAICDAYDVAAGNEDGFAKYLIANIGEFNPAEKQTLETGHGFLKQEIEWFLNNIAPVAVPNCMEKIQERSDKILDDIDTVLEVLDLSISIR